VPYDHWERKGTLNAIEGNVIHYSFIKQKIIDLRSKYEILEITFDDWGATQMMQRLTDLSKIKCAPFRQ